MKVSYKNIKAYSQTWETLDWIRKVIAIKHGISLNKSQALNMAVEQLKKSLQKMRESNDNVQ